jgi:siderophore synthetase component
MTISQIDVLRHQIDQHIADLRPMQDENLLLDRLLEQSRSTLTDAMTHRTIFFVVETCVLFGLVNTIDTKVRRDEEKLFRAHVIR